MNRDPRPANEPIFNRLMVERVALVALVVGGLTYAVFHWQISIGKSIEEARNIAMIMMVLFENAMVFASRSELKSAFATSPLRNPLLVFGTIAAILIQVAAMYLPGLSDVLQIHPVSIYQWIELVGIALLAFAAIELYKFMRRRYPLSG